MRPPDLDGTMGGHHDDGARKARWTTRGYEQTPERTRGLLLSNASSERTRCGNRRLQQRGLRPVTLEPRRNRKPCLDRAASRDRAGTRLHMGRRVSIPGSQGEPRAWFTYSANVLTSSMEMEQSRYDVCLFCRCEPRREHVDEKAGRHIDDFLVTGPEPNVRTFPGAGTRQTEHARCSASVQNR